MNSSRSAAYWDLRRPACHNPASSIFPLRLPLHAWNSGGRAVMVREGSTLPILETFFLPKCGAHRPSSIVWYYLTSQVGAIES